MAMNLAHRWLCSSSIWKSRCENKILPWALDGLDLGPSALEVGPGYGANIATLLTKTARLTVAELDPDLTARLERRHQTNVTVVEANGAALPMPDRTFSAVTCFTMLHHVPTAAEQNAVFAEACRVLEPGGTFGGCDNLDSPGMRVLHWGDTYNPLDAGTLTDRLEGAGLADVTLDQWRGMVRFRARRPE